jgi:hypothetical protein
VATKPDWSTAAAYLPATVLRALDRAAAQAGLVSDLRVVAEALA